MNYLVHITTVDGSTHIASRVETWSDVLQLLKSYDHEGSTVHIDRVVNVTDHYHNGTTPDA